MRASILICICFLLGFMTSANAVEINYAAHWVYKDVILVKRHADMDSMALLVSEAAEITLVEDDFFTGDVLSFPLIPQRANRDVREAYTSMLPEFSTVRFERVLADDEIKRLLTSQLVLVQYGKRGEVVQISYVQIARLLDELYTRGIDDADEVDNYGATISDQQVHFRLWAPTAKNVSVLVFDENKEALVDAFLSMQFDSHSGVWHASGPASLQQKFYQYQLNVFHPATQRFEQLTVTDPYSLSLSTNSVYSQVVDLDDEKTKPAGWDRQAVEMLDHPEDGVLYELHIRDFSASDLSLSNPKFRGKYSAFSERDSFGIQHLQRLREAGLTHIHLLPAFDIGTVNEDASEVIFLSDTLERVCTLSSELEFCRAEYDKTLSLQSYLEALPRNSGGVQAIIETIRDKDPYNWGYDPFHYTVPEGSYALNPDGISRIVEFRSMVKAIHAMGFRVVMDVVYNHTHAARLHKNSVLDKVVPNYYYRLNPLSGDIEQSTCCDNTATEHRMMTKLMVDSLVVWARDYKIDGFRFDLMGHQPKASMLEAYEAVSAVDEDNYFYGEGWNFGEVANNRLFVQASQRELAGTEIGTFTDRMRDALRGGTPFDEADDIRKGQGVINGLYVFPNELQGAEQREKTAYLLSMDQVRLGLAGNLANFPLQNYKGERTLGRYVPYGGVGAGYALDPADTVNYVSKHDNQTLWDNNQYRLPFNMSSDDRVRVQNLALAYAIFSQGVPFIHMGSELLRSKSFLRDSYDYGDWFNAVDFSKQSNNYNRGLPPAVKDQANWPLILQVLEKNEGRDHVSPEQIHFASRVFTDWLKIRSTSRLFRLTNEEQIVSRVSFLNMGPQQVPGLIAMKINDELAGEDLDGAVSSIIVLFNNSLEHIQFSYRDAQDYSLHPVQVVGADKLILEASATSAGFFVPRLSAVVFVKP